MPNWKKVIVSGSDASLKSLIVANGATITGSLNITGSIQTPNWIDFKTGSDQPQAIGRLGWDDGNGTLNLGLKGGNVNLQVGQEMLARVYNADSVPLTDGMIVYISGSQGNRIAVKRAVATTDALSANTLGMVTEPISVGAEGFITTQGVVNGLNTSALTAGAILYLSSSAGEYTAVKPTAPIHTVIIGYVQRSHATVGSIYIKIDNGYELGELHDIIDNTTTSSYGDLLVKSGSVWTNSKQLTGSYAITGSLTATSQLLAGSSITASSEATLILGPPPSGGSGEGGQLSLQAPGGTYTSASMLDNYQNKFRVLRGTNASSDAYKLQLDMHTGALQLPNYNSTTAITGTVAGLLAFDSSGNILTTSTGSGGGGGTIDGSGTANYVTKWQDSNTVTNSVMYDDGTNVGIGTTSPGYKLDVTGTFRSTGNTILANATNVIIKNASNYPVFEGQSSSAQIGFSRSGTTDITYIGSDASYLFRLWDESFGANYFNILQNGDVGIGTASPSAKLHIDGVTAYNTGLTVTGNTTNGVGLRLNNANGNDWYLISTGASNGGGSGNLGFYNDTVGDYRVYFKANGNVGIGVTNPNTTLEVNKTISFSSIDTYAQLIVKTTSGANGKLLNIGVDETAGLSFIQSLNRGTDSMPLILQRYSGNVGIGITNPSYKLDVNGDIHVQTSSTVGTVYFGNSAQNYLSYSDSDSYYRANGAHYFEGNGFYKGIWNADGNLGVGTTSVSGNSTNRVVSIVGADSANLVLTETGGAAGSFTSFGNELYIGTSTNHPFYLYTNNTERMRITDAGNVGIGTTSPGYKLDVNGSGRFIFRNNSNEIMDLLLSTEGAASKSKLSLLWYGNETVALKFVRGGNSTGGSMEFWTQPEFGSTTQRMVINSSGNVGIGITNPSYLLDVAGTFGTSGDATFNGTNTYINSSNIVVGNDTTDVVGLAGNTIYLPGNGNVGIGTTNPTLNTTGRVLHINAASSNAAMLHFTNGSTGTAASAGLIVGRWSDGINYMYTYNAEPVHFGTNGNIRMAITSGGNVGIGITNPSSKFEVVGTAMANHHSVYANNYNGYGFWGETGGGAYSIWMADSTTAGGQLTGDTAGNDYNMYFKMQYNNRGFIFITGDNTAHFQITNEGAFVNGNIKLTSTAGSTSTPSYIWLGNDFSNGTTRDKLKIYLYNSGTEKYGFSVGSNADIQYHSNGIHDFYISNTFSTRINSTGLAVGTTSAPGNRLIVAQDTGYTNENLYTIAAAASTNTAYKLILGYDYSQDIGVISAVQTGVAWKNLSISPNGGNVGVGTIGPSQKLHVAGNLRVTGAIYDSTNSAGSSGQILSSTGTGTDWVSLSSISGVDGTGTANYVPKWTDADTIGNSAIYDNSGNIGIGTTNPGAKLEVVGTFRATTKSFLIDHPTKEDKKLQYGVLEGPEHSVYVRGKLTGTRRIELPDYWHALIDEDSITVNLTAIGRGQQLWVEEITDLYIMVGSDSGIVNCFYTVFAERKDVDKLITEFDKE